MATAQNVREIVANGLDAAAVEAIARNVRHNGICDKTEVRGN